MRGKSVFRAVSDLGQVNSLAEIIDEEPTPDFLAILAEEHQRLMERLDDDVLRRIANWRMEGYKNEEIAQRLGLACRSVERKVQRIREAWKSELQQ